MLEKSGLYTTKLLYKFIAHRGVMSRVDGNISRCKIPLKVRIFLWQMYHGRLPTSTLLKRWGWKGNHHCSLRGSTETIDHIFFTCLLAIFLWCCIRDGLGWEGFPTSTTDFMEQCLPNGFGAHKLLALYIFTCFMWASARDDPQLHLALLFGCRSFGCE